MKDFTVSCSVVSLNNEMVLGNEEDCLHRPMFDDCLPPTLFHLLIDATY